jgi:signal transduction histidine kinase
VGVVTWLVVGRVLAPVEAIRREVEAISPTELHRRVPDPPGRDEIARLAGTMNAMLARLEEGHRRERRLVADASHELRSPIASIRQHAEVAVAHPEASSPTEVAETVLQEALRLQRIVDDLLLLARLDEGSPRPPSEPLDLDDLVFDEARRVRTSTSLRIDVHGVSGGRILGNRTELDRLVRNLMDNAVRHGRAVVELSLREEHDRVVLVVEDDGPGVPEGERSRVFERFVRLDDARGRDAGGSGLGLAIVHDVAAAHGATVRVLDGELGGARFEVAFPAVEGPPRRSGSFSGRSAVDRHAPSHPDDDPATGPGGDDEP